jgi:hypothetical protein
LGTSSHIEQDLLAVPRQVDGHTREPWHQRRQGKDFLKLAKDQWNLFFQPFDNINPYISTA